MVRLTTITSAAIAFSFVTAHPGEHHDHEHVKHEIKQRDLLAARAADSLSQCSSSVKARELNQRAITRRAAAAERLRKERGIEQNLHSRDLAALQSFENVNHNLTGIQNTDTIFAANTSCILTPEDIVGPYYVSGEMVRSDVTEGTKGVAVHLEMQFINIDTCEPIPNLLVDIWAANATGVYSGVNAAGQGGLQTTFLRGLQQSNSEGVVEFDTLFPGHYTGRATHEHLMVHTNATLLANGSYTGGQVQHIGQLFFDENLRSAVEATSPYNTNTAAITSNNDDMWAPQQADNNYDPFPKYVYLGDGVSDGLLMWISIGISTSANYDEDASAAAYLAADGGHATSGGMNGGGGPNGSGGPGNFTTPGGMGNGTVVGNSTTRSPTATSGISSGSTGSAVSNATATSGARKLQAFWNNWL